MDKLGQPLPLAQLSNWSWETRNERGRRQSRVGGTARGSVSGGQKTYNADAQLQRDVAVRGSDAAGAVRVWVCDPLCLCAVGTHSQQRRHGRQPGRRAGTDLPHRVAAACRGHRGGETRALALRCAAHARGRWQPSEQAGAGQSGPPRAARGAEVLRGCRWAHVQVQLRPSVSVQRQCAHRGAGRHSCRAWETAALLVTSRSGLRHALSCVRCSARERLLTCVRTCVQLRSRARGAGGAPPHHGPVAAPALRMLLPRVIVSGAAHTALRRPALTFSPGRSCARSNRRWRCRCSRPRSSATSWASS
jgi:hypothetical protein